MIVHQRRSPLKEHIAQLLRPPSVNLSSPFRLSSDFAISKAWATGVTRFTTGFLLLSHFFQLSVFPSTTHNIMTLTVAFRVAISNIQQVLIPFVGIRDVRNPLLLLVIVNESSAHLFRLISSLRSSYSYALFIHMGQESSSLSSSTWINCSAASLASCRTCLHLIRNNSSSNKAIHIKVMANIFTPTQYLIPFLVTSFHGHSGYTPKTL